MKNARIAAQEWWVNELRDLTQKVIKQEERRKEKTKQKNAGALAEYKSADEIRDAYGYGFITEKKCEKLLAMWEESNVAESEVYRIQIEILSDLYAEAKSVLHDLEGGNNGRTV